MSTTANPTRREPELLGQTVVVIGGSAGIGLETARRARAEGASVILTGRNRRTARASGARGRRRAHRRLRRQRSGRPAVVLPGSARPDRPRDGHRRRAALRPPLEMPPEEARHGLSEHLLLALNVARGAAGKVRPAGSLIFMGGTGARRPRAWPRHRLDGHRRVPRPHRQPCAGARADPRQPDRRGLRRHAALGIAARRRSRQAARRAPRDAAHPARRRAGRRRRARRSHHEQHGADRRDLRYRRRPAARLMITRGSHRYHRAIDRPGRVCCHLRGLICAFKTLKPKELDMSDTLVRSETAVDTNGRLEARGRRPPCLGYRPRQAFLRRPGLAARCRLPQEGRVPGGSVHASGLAFLHTSGQSAGTLSCRVRYRGSAQRAGRARRQTSARCSTAARMALSKAATPSVPSYGSLASFSDPDGNSWMLQEVTTRLPGRVDTNTTSPRRAISRPR